MLLTTNAPARNLRCGKKKQKALLCYPKTKDIHTREMFKRTMEDAGAPHVMENSPK